MADRLGQAIRDTDTVAFLDADGPPRFAIVLPETDEQGAALAADKIRRSIASTRSKTSRENSQVAPATIPSTMMKPGQGWRSCGQTW